MQLALESFWCELSHHAAIDGIIQVLLLCNALLMLE